MKFRVCNGGDGACLADCNSPVCLFWFILKGPSGQSRCTGRKVTRLGKAFNISWVKRLQECPALLCIPHCSHPQHSPAVLRTHVSSVFSTRF